MKNRIVVTLKEQILKSSRVMEFPAGTSIKTLTYGGTVFMRVSKPIEVSTSYPGKMEGAHGEVAIAPYVPNDDEVFLFEGSESFKMTFEQKSVEYKTTITIPAGSKVKYFVMEDYKENPNQSLIVKDGCKWIEVELL